MKRLSLILLAVGLLSGACLTVKTIHYEDDKAIAINHVIRFRELYNEEKFADAYKLLSPRLTAEMTEGEFVAQMQKMKAESGRIVEGKEAKFEIVPLASSREVRLLYDAKFENGPFNEGYAILVDGDNAVIDMLAFGLWDPAAWKTK